MDRLKVLFLTPQLPYPPHKGTTLRNYNLIAHLADSAHTLALLSFASAGDTVSGGDLPERIDTLRQYCASVVAVAPPQRSRAQRAITTLTSPLPDMAFRLRSPQFSARLHEVLASFCPDLVQFEGIEMARYLPEVRNKAYPPRTVLDDHNAEYVLQQRTFETDRRQPGRWVGAAYSLLQWQKLRRWEAQICRTVDRVVAVSDADAAALRRIVPEQDIAVVPNGIDTAWQAQVNPADVARCRLAPLQLIFTGTMDFRPNIDAVTWFCDAVFPQVRAVHPEAVFVICGNSPAARVRALAAQPGVVVTGSVADTRPYIAASTLYVVPLRIGGGTRFKILEAMAGRVPVVSTRLGAEGFALQPAHAALVESAGEFVQAILSLLADPARRAAQAKLAHAYVAATYDWDMIAPRMAQAWDAATRS